MDILTQILLWIAPLVGGGALIVGLAATFFPKPASKAFGIPATDPALPYVRAVGARDVFLGLAILLTTWMGNRTLLSTLFFSTALVAIVDFSVTWRGGSRRLSLCHLAGAVLSVLYGVWLLG
jgi:hypothetical protein